MTFLGTFPRVAITFLRFVGSQVDKNNMNSVTSENNSEERTDSESLPAGGFQRRNWAVRRRNPKEKEEKEEEEEEKGAEEKKEEEKETSVHESSESNKSSVADDAFVESATASEAETPAEVHDTKNYVFIIFLVFGFGSLLPWNMFLNISFDYYTMFKLRETSGNSTWFSANFQNSMTISAQIPSLIFSIVSVFFAAKGDLTPRMRICLVIVQLMIILTVLCIYINTSSWIAVFFVLTLVTIIVLNAANGLFQNSMFGLASPFPFKYTNAIIIGQNFCGTAVTALSMITKWIYEDVQMRAMLFFCLSSVAIVTCFVLLNFIKRLTFYKRYGNVQKSDDSNPTEKTTWQDIKQAFSKSKMQFFNVFILFFVTLSLFPNICMYVQDAPKGEKYSFIIPEKYFMDVATFLNFNLFAFLGSLLANWVRFPGPKTIWIPVMARFWFMFYFPAANYIPLDAPRVYPVLFHSTWLFVFNVSIFALTSGYLSSLVMMYAPRAHEEPQIQRMAGMIASFCLIFGILVGLVFSWQIRMFMTGYL